MADTLNNGPRIAQHWFAQIETEKEAHRGWREFSRDVVKTYRQGASPGRGARPSESRFNLLWSNTELLSVAVHGKSPTPDVRRRFSAQGNRDAANAAEVLERALSYAVDTDSFTRASEAAVVDYLLSGLGTMRVRYTPYIVDDEVMHEEVSVEPVPWYMFHWEPASNWEKVEWCAIENHLSKAEVKEQYPDWVQDIPFSSGYTWDWDSESDIAQNDEKNEKQYALIYEIFDKRKREVIILAEGLDDVIEVIADPLELEDFYPFPPPLAANITSGEFLPTPDYAYYKKEAELVSSLTGRIAKLQEYLKYRGMYDPRYSDSLERVLRSEDGSLTPMEIDTSLFQEVQQVPDLEKAIKVLPLEEVVSTISRLQEIRQNTIDIIHQITGISDIMRGSTSPSETLGAQRLKTHFGSVRIERRQRIVAEFLRSVIGIMGEVISEFFFAETLEMVADMPVTDEAVSILRSDQMRRYKIDIETDSTVVEDAALDQQRRTEMLTAITGFMERVAPLVAEGMIPVDMARELMLFGVRSFKGGRALENIIESFNEQTADAPYQGSAPADPALALPEAEPDF